MWDIPNISTAHTIFSNKRRIESAKGNVKESECKYIIICDRPNL